MHDDETRQAITAAIHSLAAEWIEEGRIQHPRDIGDGQCEDFAHELADRLHNIQDLEVLWSDNWWIDDFVADIDRLRREGAPLPSGVEDRHLADLIGSATHAWIHWNGLHFDATAPNGKDHFLEMPFYADQIAMLCKGHVR